jgi:methylated-DNA-[protein]-cysteine S-methyltransferase
MAADLILRHLTVATPLGAFAIVGSPTGVVATTGGDVEDLLGRLVGRLDAEVRTPVDLRLARTPLARGILEITRTIPYGELWTYGDVAAAAGRRGAARAAGTTLAHSPIEIFVPCHRVVPAGPGLGSYGGEEDRRATLLRLEHAI